jgi:hydroxymethylglutaryl-CoA synthase
VINYKKLTGMGIVGYGTYVPRARISVREIAAAHQMNGENFENNLGIYKKSVANWDEDAATMAYMAASQALDMAQVKPELIGAVYAGSESHPYAVKPTASIVGEALGIGNEYLAADLEFACKAGTSGVQILAAQIAAEIIDYGVAIGTDKAQAEPGDVLEYSAAAGAAALILGKKKIVAKLLGMYSYASDTADFWRRAEQKYPKHAGRFTGEPAYFKHVIAATEAYLKLSNTGVGDWDQVVFHMPNGKFPARVAEKLGFSKDQLALGFIVSEIGNPYSASTLLGICRVLDLCMKQTKILAVSYGSGSGSDVLAFETTPLLLEKRLGKGKWHKQKTYDLDYGKYRVLTD